jgi:hypothetical protein
MSWKQMGWFAEMGGMDEVVHCSEVILCRKAFMAKCKRGFFSI